MFIAGGFGALKGYETWKLGRTEEFKESCRKSVQQKNWEQLIITSKEWSEWQPEAADPWLFLGEGHLQSGDPEKALEALDQIPTSHPKAIPALVKKSEIEFDLLNQPLRSEKTSLKLLQLEPRVSEIRSRLISFYALTLQRVRLIEQIQESIRLGSEPPEAYVYLLLCDYLYLTNGSQVNSKWAQSAPDAEVFRIAAAIQFDIILQRLANQTDDTLQSRRDSQEKLDRYLEQYPGNPALLRYFLHNYAEESKVEEVARILAMVPPDAGNDSVFWRFRGWYQSAINELDGAEEAYRKSLELMSLDWRTWQGLSEVLRLKGELQEAERCQKIALTGKQLRQELQQLPTARDITDALLDRISEYADACGDTELAAHLQYRLSQRGYRG